MYWHMLHIGQPPTWCDRRPQTHTFIATTPPKWEDPRWTKSLDLQHVQNNSHPFATTELIFGRRTGASYFGRVVNPVTLSILGPPKTVVFERSISRYYGQYYHYYRYLLGSLEELAEGGRRHVTLMPYSAADL